jgi:peptide/nickel transport system permease protein
VVVFMARRVLAAIPLLFMVSVVSFTIIKLPPVDYLDIRIAQLKAQGNPNAELVMQELRVRYGLDQPAWKQYVRWAGGLLRGDMGVSFDLNERPVIQIFKDRLPATLILTLSTLIFQYVVAIPIGIYCATHQYSIGDHIFSFIGFIGMATPSFLLALIIMFAIVMYTPFTVGGLFSPEYATAPWSLAKFINMLSHIWIPVVIIGLTGTAGLIRIMRSSLLEVLGHQYVTTARAKGVKEFWVIYKHALRVAINPIITIIGLTFPAIIAGEGLVAVIMNMPTLGPVFIRSLQVLDMYLAGSFLMVTACFVILGNLVSDILLAWTDPRIRFE